MNSGDPKCRHCPPEGVNPAGDVGASGRARLPCKCYPPIGSFYGKLKLQEFANATRVPGCTKQLPSYSSSVGSDRFAER
jgi:hypothetical protein